MSDQRLNKVNIVTTCDQCKCLNDYGCCSLLTGDGPWGCKRVSLTSLDSECPLPKVEIITAGYARIEYAEEGCSLSEWEGDIDHIIIVRKRNG